MLISSVKFPSLPSLRKSFREKKPPKSPSWCNRRLTNGNNTRGSDKGCRPHILNLRAGGIAARSDALAVGDHLVAVNGIRTNGLRHDEIVNLLRGAQDNVVLEVEYQMPSTPTEASACVCSKVIQIKLCKANGSFGFTLRGGTLIDPLRSRSLLITHVRPDGPADREGTIRAGDRLLAIDGISVHDMALSEAQFILRTVQYDQESLLTIEYDVSVMDTVQYASGPLLVEIERTTGSSLGLTLSHAYHDPTSVVIDSIKQASVAERCGALHVGDQLIAVNGTRLECRSASEASQILRSSGGVGNAIRLEILPLSQLSSSFSRRFALDAFGGTLRKGFSSGYALGTGSTSCGSGYSTLNSHHRSSKNRPRLFRSDSISKQETGSPLNGSTVTHLPPLSPSSTSGGGGVCHPESLIVTLHADQRLGSFGFGLGESPRTYDPNDTMTCSLTGPPLVNSIDPGGAADKCGILQLGDRILFVNNQSTEGLTPDEVMHLVTEGRPRISLEIEFNVAESVVPSSGIFTVKLAKRGNGLGITLTAPKNRPTGEPLLISDVKKGSVAHRTGTIQPGDRLLAIDTVRLDHCTLEDAAQILHNAGEIVKLRIQKDDSFSEEPDKSIVYTVELVRHGGPLGITISGTEEPFDPILISSLTEGGLAEKTAALHIGDRLLAINGKTLRGKPLSEAILLLQNSGDIVTLKISRNVPNTKSGLAKGELDRDEYLGKFGPALPSIDSAVESWDSCALDPSNSSAPVSSGSSNSKRGSITEIYKAESATVKRKQKVLSACDSPEPNADHWDNFSQSSHSVDSGQSAGASMCKGEKGNWEKILDELDTSGQVRLVNDSNYVQSRCSSNIFVPPVLSTFQVPEDVPDVNRDVCNRLRSSSHSLDNGQFSTELCTTNGHRQPPLPDELILQCKSVGNSELWRNNTLPHRNKRLQDESNTTLDILPPPNLKINGYLDNDNSYNAFTNNMNDNLTCFDHCNGGAGSSICSVTGTTSSPSPTLVPVEIHKVTLFKDRVYEDFGFSVSDGLYERGVFVNRIRRGGPADLSGILKPYDRILQVNETRTHDFDCCLTVPLIAAAGDKLELVLARNPFATQEDFKENFGGLPWFEDEREHCASPVPILQSPLMITKTL